MSQPDVFRDILDKTRQRLRKLETSSANLKKKCRSLIENFSREVKNSKIKNSWNIENVCSFGGQERIWFF